MALTIPDLSHLQKMSARFAPIDLRVDTGALSPGDKKALGKAIQASAILNDLFLEQMWSGNHALAVRLAQDRSTLGMARASYFWMNKSPWSNVDGNTAFLPGVPARKLPGANFYPEDMTKEEFEKWPQHKAAEDFFSVIRRQSGKLVAVPYSKEYARYLEPAAKLLHEAAALTDNASLRKFLNLRADAFLSNDYYASDVAWMDVKAPLDITIGPYETYNDEIFGYKAGFEAYITLVDSRDDSNSQFLGSKLQEIENNLPIDSKYRNPKLGALAPIRVVNEIYAAGDGAHGVRTAAYNLPNDERVVHEKGSKRVMLKNVQEAKFHANLEPIAKRVLPDTSMLDFGSFFTHILAHELTHGIGPHQIHVNGRATTVRQELKDLYSAIEEAKADVTGMFMLQHLKNGDARKLHTTFLASSFRTLRFGITEAHGKGMAIQFNFLADQGAFVRDAQGRYRVDDAKMVVGIRALAHELLTIEATGDYAAAKKLVASLAVVRPELQKTLDALTGIPVDIAPLHATAREIYPGAK